MKKSEFFQQVHDAHEAIPIGADNLHPQFKAWAEMYGKLMDLGLEDQYYRWKLKQCYITKREYDEFIEYRKNEEEFKKGKTA